jgi:hypothetical protein
MKPTFSSVQKELTEYYEEFKGVNGRYPKDPEELLEWYKSGMKKKEGD